MKTLIKMFLAVMLFFPAITKAQITLAKPILADSVYNSVALLYSQDEQGGMKMRCTTTAFEHDVKTKTYKFVTAAHCVATDDKDHEKIKVEEVPLFVTFDEIGEKKFIPAKLLAVGYQSKGDDFCVLEVKSEIDIPVTPLGDDKSEALGSEVISVASPEGFGKQLFHGWISSKNFDRPIVEGDINWKGTILLQIQSGPGSSGSSIVSVKQGAIVAFLVGHAAENTIAMPVSRMKTFYKQVQDGKYKYYKPEAEVQK